MKCLQLNTPNEQVMSILMTCLLLPDTNLRLLQYLCQFVSKVAAHSEESKMTLNNLAIILSPNLMFTCRDKDSDKYVKEQTEVVDILFKNANSIGWVNDEVLDKVNGMEGETCSISTSSADELEVAMVSRQRRNRRRSRSISGRHGHYQIHNSLALVGNDGQHEYWSNQHLISYATKQASSLMKLSLSIVVIIIVIIIIIVIVISVSSYEHRSFRFSSVSEMYPVMFPFD